MPWSPRSRWWSCSPSSTAAAPAKYRGEPAGHRPALGPDPHDAVLRDLGRRQLGPPGRPAVRVHPPARAGDRRLAVRPALARLLSGAPFLLVVVGQVAIQIGLSLGPALYVMARELGPLAPLRRRPAGGLRGDDAHQPLHGAPAVERRPGGQGGRHRARLRPRRDKTIGAGSRFIRTSASRSSRSARPAGPWLTW